MVLLLKRMYNIDGYALILLTDLLIFLGLVATTIKCKRFRCAGCAFVWILIIFVITSAILFHMGSGYIDKAMYIGFIPIGVCLMVLFIGSVIVVSMILFGCLTYVCSLKCRRKRNNCDRTCFNGTNSECSRRFYFMFRGCWQSSTRLFAKCLCNRVDMARIDFDEEQWY